MQQRRLRLLPTMSLRVKLVLSYLLVALGAVLILAFVVSFAVQNYFANSQMDQLRSLAQYEARNISQSYATEGAGAFVLFRSPSPDTVVVGTDGQLPAQVQQAPDLATLISPSVQQSLHGQVVSGHFNVKRTNDPRHDEATSFLYASVPIYQNTDGTGAVIGALWIDQPEQYPKNTQNAFLFNVKTAILISGLLVSLGVIAFSLFMSRRLTHPLEALTTTAEQMKRGEYEKRVEVPKSQDELERLALTFNAMADTIEADVTELRQQDQIRRELIANIAHDLATPLTAIQGFSEALADDLIPTAEARHETAQRIGREVQRLRRLVADIQQMSSLESGQTKLDLAPLDLRSLVDETLAVIEPECEEAAIVLHNELASTTPIVFADSDRVTQVLLNLLDNARRHTPRGGSITITTSTIGRMLSISVMDTGTGIDAADLPHIFERFYRADRSRTGTTGGSGLGLSIVKAIIVAHGGTIYAESTPGKGTRITFSLPLAAPTSQTAPMPPIMATKR
jgi:signal transduction histidine kinase